MDQRRPKKGAALFSFGLFSEDAPPFFVKNDL